MEIAVPSARSVNLPPMKSLLTADETRVYLGPYLPDIRDCLVEGDEQYREERNGLVPLGPRARACCVSDIVAMKAATKFGDTPGVTLIFRDDDTLRAIAFGDRAVVRFKKLNRRLRISAIETGPSMAWNRQQPLENFPTSTNLVAGYVLDDVGELEALKIVCSLNGRPLWWLDLDDVDGLSNPVLDLTPNDAPTPPRAIVRSKLKDDEEARTDR